MWGILGVRDHSQLGLWLDLLVDGGPWIEGVRLLAGFVGGGGGAVPDHLVLAPFG